MKAFLSSTYVDLIEHRKLAAEALQRLGQEVGRMEVFGARPEEATQACLSEIEACDIFVGLYAHRYGYVPSGSGISITEAEYNHAAEHNKPIFCYMVDEDFPWPPKMIEEQPGKFKLHEFKQRVGGALVRDTFTTPEVLAFKIASSVGRYLTQVNKPSTGAIQKAPTGAVDFGERRQLTSVHFANHADLRFTVTNLSKTPQKVGLALDIMEIESFRLPAIKKAGAILSYYDLAASLEKVEEIDLLAGHDDVEVILAPGESEAFRLRLSSQEGRRYKCRLIASFHDVATQQNARVESLPFTVDYPARSAASLRKGAENE